MSNERNIDDLIALLPNQDKPSATVNVIYGDSDELIRECAEINSLREIVDQINEPEYSLSSGT